MEERNGGSGYQETSDFYPAVFLVDDRTLFSPDWKRDISAQLRYRDLAHGKTFKVVTTLQTKLFLQEQELRERNSQQEVEIRKLRTVLQRQDGEEDPELENYKRQLADFKLHQGELIKSMEEEVGRWSTKCVQLEQEAERLRIDLQRKEEEIYKIKNKDAPRLKSQKPVSLPQRVMRILATDNEITASLAFNNDGHHLAAAGQGRNIKIFDTSSGRLEYTLTDPSMRSVLYVGFSPPTRGLGSPKGRSNDVVQHPYQEFLIATSTDGAARLWSMDDIEAALDRKSPTVSVKHTLRGHSGVVSCASFSADAVKVVTGSYDRSLKLWDLGKGYPIRQMQTFSPCSAVCIASEENLISSGHADGKMYLWDPKTGERVHEFNVHTKRITSLALSPALERRHIMTVSQDNTIKIFDIRKLASNESIQPLHVIGGSIPKGMGSGAVTLNVGGGSGRSHSYRIASDWAKACWSPDGVYAACGFAGGLLFIWNLNTNTESALKTSALQLRDVHCCDWYGDTLASCGVGGDVVLWTPEASTADGSESKG